MNQAVLDMLEKYQITKPEDAENAMKEIIQEIALLGLHRANFFEKAAFYRPSYSLLSPAILGRFGFYVV